MKKKILSAAAALLMTASCCAPVLAGGVPGAVNRAADSVVRITAKTSLGTEKTSGIVISSGDKKYVLAELRSVESGDLSVGMSEEENIPASIAARDAEKDLAILELGEVPEGAKPVKFRKGKLKNSDRVFAVGYYANADEANITEGEILSVNDYSAGGISVEIYRTDAAVTERNNGGMLSDSHGNAVGICCYDGNISENKAVTSGEIFTVLDANEINYKTATILYLLIAIVLAAAAAAAAAYKIFTVVKAKKENVPKLIGVTGDFAGQEIPVTSESINIGRDAKICQIVILSDSKVSRCHCSVRYDDMKRAFILTDLSSTHGTYVNGERLEQNVPKYLSPGTVFNVGDSNTSFKTAEGGVGI